MQAAEKDDPPMTAQCILVLGMHRSGTSALTRALNLLGAALPKQVMPPKEGVNPLGFWEPQAVYQLNERLLHSRNSFWSDWSSWAEPHEPDERMRDILKDEFDAPQACVLKDPRMCRMLPSWKVALEERFADIAAVLTVRHPLAVRDSLQKRDGFSTETCLLLWLRHVLDAVHYSAHLPRLVVNYDALVASPADQSQRLLDWMDAHGLRHAPPRLDAVKSFLSEQHRHHDYALDNVHSHPALKLWVAESYIALKNLAAEHDVALALQTLSRVREDFEQHCTLFAPPLKEALEDLDQSRKDNRELMKHNSTQAELLAASKEIDAQKGIELRALHAQLENARSQLQSEQQRASELKGQYRAARSEAAQRKKRQRTTEAQLQRTLFKARQFEDQGKRALQALAKQTHFALATHAPHSSLVLGTKALIARLRTQGASAALRLIMQGLFCPAWYLQQYPDVATQGQSAFKHWWRLGWREGRNPHPYFQMRWYLAQNPDVADAGLNPLIHFLEHGEREGRQPALWFDSQWYLANNPDVEKAGLSPFAHFCQFGLAEGRSPSPIIVPERIAEQLDISTFAANAIAPWLLAHTQTPTSPLLDNDWYLQRYDDVAKHGMNAALHYLQYGQAEGRQPCPNFAVEWYAEKNRLAPEKVLAHYLFTGGPHGASCHPDWPTLKLGEHEQPLRPIATSLFTASSLNRASQAVLYRTSPDDRQAGDRISGHQSVNGAWPNILLCAHTVAAKTFGGERSFLELLALAEEMPFNVFVALPAFEKDYETQVRRLSAGIIYVPYRFHKLDEAADAALTTLLVSYLREQHIALVHVNTIVVREPLEAAKQAGVPSLIHVRESVHHDRWLADKLGGSAQAIVNWVQDSASGIIANSSASAHEFGQGIDSWVVPNTFDLDALDRLNRISASSITVGMLSSNIPKKGLDDFVAVANALHDNTPRVEFLLIGPENEYTRAIQERQAKGEISDNLKIVGYIPNSVDAVLRCNIVVNLSHFAESFGRSIAEAAAARRAVIVYDRGALPQLVIHGESGAIVPADDWQAVAAQIRGWSREPEQILRLGAAGRRHIANHFSRANGRRTLLQAYKSLLKKHPAQALQPLRGCKRKVAYFCWHFPVPSETFVLNELRELVTDGVMVEVFCRQSPHPDFKPDFPIRWTRVQTPEELQGALAHGHFEHVHAHFVYPTVTEFVWPACRAAGIPFTFIAHAQDIFRHHNDERNRIADIAQDPLCRAIFTLGEFHRSFLIARGVPDQKIVINPNAVDLRHFSFQSTKVSAKPHNERFKLCAIHRWTAKKGLMHLIAAAAELRDANIEIHIYGYGEEEDALRAQAHAVGSSHLFVHGRLTDRDAVRSALLDSDAFVNASVRTDDGDMDGIPTSVIEAMALGVPVLTTSIASIPDLVQDRVTGIVVESGSPSSLAAGVRRLLNLSAVELQQMRLNARAAVERRHDAKRLSRHLERFWDDEVLDIIIVSWNNLNQLQEVIRRIRELTRSRFRLCICDNNSSAETRLFLQEVAEEDPRVVVHFNDNNALVGPGTNIAAALGDGRFIVYVCGKEGFALHAGWELPLLAYMDEHPEVGQAGTLCYSPAYPDGQGYKQNLELFPKFRHQEFAEQNPQRRFFHVQGGLFIMRRTAFDDIGGFSDEVPHAYTDVEFSYALEASGWKIGRAPNMLALFNKTRPHFRHRIDESIGVIHPPVLEDLELLDSVSADSTKYCGICSWHGQAFTASQGEDFCPDCGATASDRSIARWIADSDWTYSGHRLAIYGCGESLSEFAKPAFRMRSANVPRDLHSADMAIVGPQIDAEFAWQLLQELNETQGSSIKTIVWHHLSVNPLTHPESFADLRSWRLENTTPSSHVGQLSLVPTFTLTRQTDEQVHLHQS